MKRNLIKGSLLSALLIGLPFSTAWSQTSERDAITDALNNYLLGSSYNDPERIKSAFYPEAEMFLDHPERPIFLMKPERYADGFGRRVKGEFNGRYGKILSIDIEGGIASAKAEILLPARNSRYIDLFLLKKLEGEWKIISKAAGRSDSRREGAKAMLILTGKNMRADLSDLISVYEQTVAAGYTVEFVSSDGGAISLKNVNMRKEKHRDYMYDPDFMYAIQHTLSGSTIDAEDYVAARFVNNRHQRRARSGHKQLDSLFVAICEESSACEN